MAFADQNDFYRHIHIQQLYADAVNRNINFESMAVKKFERHHDTDLFTLVLSQKQDKLDEVSFEQEKPKDSEPDDSSYFKLESENTKEKKVDGVPPDKPVLTKAPRSSKKLLPSEGNIGTYDELIKAGKRGDNITPHHAPSAEYMRQHGVKKGDGLSINMEQPPSGGRHRMTDTYGRNMTDAEKAYYYSLSPRDALAYDLKNIKKIYQEQGLLKEIAPKLKKYSNKYQKLMPELFKKGGK